MISYLDERTVPERTTDMVVAGVSLYLLFDSQDKISDKIQELGDIFGKHAYGITGESENYGPFATVGDAIFFPGDAGELFRVEGTLMQRKTIDQIIRDVCIKFKLPRIYKRDISDIGSDGNLVYVELDGDKVLLLDYNLSLAGYLHHKGIDYPTDLVTGKSRIFLPKGELSWSIYSDGRLVGELELAKWAVDDREKMFRAQIEKKSEAGTCGSNCGDLLFSTFTDGIELYGLTSTGNVWHVDARDSHFIGRINIDWETGLLFAHNGIEGIVITEGEIASFSKGQELGTDKLDIPLKDISKITMDRDYLYILIDNRIVRYAISR